MAGLYIHIPFCKQACHYCNFHFTTSLRYKSDLLGAIKKELELRKGYLEENLLETIYFGGGTPSLLTPEELNDLFLSIKSIYKISPDAEITLEANPDDLTEEYLAELKETSVNRISIGIQSFHEADLVWMNRAHNVDQAHNAIKWSIQAGFDKLSIDLIYGSVTTSDEQWLENIKIALDYDINHISSYCLTVEEKTPLAKMLKTGNSLPVSEDQASRQFNILIDTLESAEYEQYEISNFAKNKLYAKHNTAYWQGKNYLGLGPSAHSFNGASRSWNIANNQKYIKSLEESILPLESEILTKEEKYNEMLMTGLRTMWGINRSQVKELSEDYLTLLDREIKYYLDREYATKTGDNYILLKKGKFLADRIASDLFIV